MDDFIDVTKAVYDYLRKMLKITTISLFCSVAECNIDTTNYTVVYRFRAEPVNRLVVPVPNHERVLAIQLPVEQSKLADMLLEQFSVAFSATQLPPATIVRFHELIDDMLSDLQHHYSIWTEHNVGNIVIYNKIDYRNLQNQVIAEEEIDRLLSECADLADIVYS